MSCPSRRNHCALTVSISSTDADLIAPFRLAWGGYCKLVSQSSERHKPAWRWTIAGRVAADFLRVISPYCRVARIRKKIALGIEFQEQKHSSTRINRSTEYRARQVLFFRRMKALNQRGRQLCPNANQHRNPR